MEAFGSDLLKPNSPKVPISLAGDLVAWAWGRELHVYSREKASEIYTLTEDTFITAITAAEGDWAIVTDGRQLLLRDMPTGDLKESFFLHRRLAAISYGPLHRFLVADKFGDVSDLSIEDIRKASLAAAQLVATHAAHNPEDTLFSEKNEAALRKVEAAPLSAAEERRQAEEEILLSSLSGHLATITQAGFVTLTCKDGATRNFVLACDRDEKIRLSRYPELWIIQAIFCGHSEFVSDMLVMQEDDSSPLLASVGADKTLRIWNVKNGDELAKATLPEVPFRLLATKESLQILYCGNTLVSEYSYRMGQLHHSGDRHLPAVPVALAKSYEDDDFVWLDVEGNLREKYDGSILVSARATTERPYFVRHWKHTREGGVLSAEERRAKLRKGSVRDDNELLDNDDDITQCKKN